MHTIRLPVLNELIKHLREGFRLFVMHAGLDAPGCTSSTSSRQIKNSITDRPHARDNIKRSVQFLPASPSDIGPTKKRKLLPSSGIL